MAMMSPTSSMSFLRSAFQAEIVPQDTGCFIWVDPHTKGSKLLYETDNFGYIIFYFDGPVRPVVVVTS